MRYLLLISFLTFFYYSHAQNPTGHLNNFNSTTNTANFTGGNGYMVTSYNNNTEIAVNASLTEANAYPSFSYSIVPTVDLTDHPYVQVRMWANKDLQVRIDLQDVNGKVTNAVATAVSVPLGGGFLNYTFDFSGKFTMAYGGNGTVDASKISKLLFIFNPGKTYTGTVHMDDLKIGSETNVPPPMKEIRMNQIGFYPGLSKIGVGFNLKSSKFYIVSEDKQDTLYTGDLGPKSKWSSSGDSVRIADFSDFKSTGNFYLTSDELYSTKFSIQPDVHHALSKGLIKSYYYNRASMGVEAQYGGVWARPAGHPDNDVIVHSSAAGGTRPVNAHFSSSKGWYDAGDYNKYVVNSGITTYTLLAIYEHYPEYFDTVNLNIPESGNGLPDVLDEALWNIEWLLTTQDPGDGSVYHKITQLQFCGDNVSPAADNSQRYAVQRTTAATLDFAAVMAQSYRIFKNIPGYEDFANQCIQAAIKAYAWAVKNPNVIYSQPSDVGTGTYGDGSVTDEMAWAKMELYAATRNDLFYDHAATTSASQVGIPGWPSVKTLGIITLVNYRRQLDTAGYADTTAHKNLLMNLANGLVSYANSSPMKMAMGKDGYYWGSNAVAGNQGLVLLQAFRLTGDSSYLKVALSNLDYIIGRNGTGRSYVTGFGARPPMKPHHRISNADNVAAPVPGMVVGGANPQQSDGCSGYPSPMEASSYLDTYCSFSTNEPAINYTAPVAYLANAIEAIMAGAKTNVPEYTDPPEHPLGVHKAAHTIGVRMYPNPSRGELSVEFQNEGTGRIQVLDATGKVVMDEFVTGNNLVVKGISVAHLPSGMYTVVITNDTGSGAEKLIKQ